MKNNTGKKFDVLGALKEDRDIYIILVDNPPFKTVIGDIIWIVRDIKKVMAIVDNEAKKIEVIGRKKELEAILAGIGAGVPSMAEAIQLLKEAM